MDAGGLAEAAHGVGGRGGGVPAEHGPIRVALLGNPNTGKTTLFNRLSGLRHKTSNFPGTTLEARVGRVLVRGERAAGGAECCGADGGAIPGKGDGTGRIELIDLPGIYSLELDQAEAEICRGVLEGRAAPRGELAAEPDAVCVVADATNLARNLVFVGEALRRRLPTVVAVNMIDLARRKGLTPDTGALGARLGCEVVAISARTGEGVAELESALLRARVPNHTPPGDEAGLVAWAEGVYEDAAGGGGTSDSRSESPRGDWGDRGAAAARRGGDELTDRIDRVVTHPVLGLVVFVLVMGALFWAIFSLAQYPMSWIESVFGLLSGAVNGVMPEGFLRGLIGDGVVNGVGATVVFLPQICLLFFLISILEDTGYLARAALMMDRLLRPFGLPGHAFVPLLSSHACALPGIMAARGIPDRRERIATILAAPFMTCSARLPVYVLVTGVLFPGSAWKSAAAFIGCYALGIGAGVMTALLVRRTILRGASRPMALELPTYKWPSVRTALLTTWDRGLVFLRKAGTNILAICVVLWWLSHFPIAGPPREALELRERAAAITAVEGTTAGAAGGAVKEGGAPPANAEDMLAEADRLERSNQQRQSFAGRMGRAAQPAFAPLGYDWQLTVGVLTSFAAREVFVSTMAVMVLGEDDTEDSGVLAGIGAAERDDGMPVFTPAVCWSLLVFYVLAMQCLPTLVVTAREAGGAKWAVLQFAWMSGVAYVAAMAVYWIAA